MSSRRRSYGSEMSVFPLGRKVRGQFAILFVLFECRTFVGRNDDRTSLRLDVGAVDRGMLSDEPLRSGRSRSIGVDDMTIL